MTMKLQITRFVHFSIINQMVREFLGRNFGLAPHIVSIRPPSFQDWQNNTQNPDRILP